MSEKRRDSKGRILRTGEVQRTNGQYMFRYVGTDGKRKTIYSWKLVDTDKEPDGKRSKASLRDMEKQIQRDLNDEINANDANSITVNDLFYSFLEIRTDLKMTTRCNYIDVYNGHVKDAIGCQKISNVRFTDIQKLYIDLAQNGKLKYSTILKIQSILSQMFENAVMDNLIRTNPTLNATAPLRKTIQTHADKRHALTVEEQSILIDYVYGSKQFERFGPMLTILLGTGMRIGEALGLRWSDCDFEQNLISVNHALLYKSDANGNYEYRISTTKTIAGMRIIPMFSDVKAALLKLKSRKLNPAIEEFSVDGYRGFIFLNGNGKVFTPSFIFDVFRRIVVTYNKQEYFAAEKAGREPRYLPKFSAHILRHTFCTRICENETNIKVIQDIMGHQNIRTTMDVYNEATKEKKIESFQNIEGKIKLS